MQEINKIRWVLAHEPIELFLRTAEKFCQELARKTNNRLSVEVLTLSQYADKYNNKKPVSKNDLLALMDAKKIEMSQVYTTTLGRISRDFQALDLPFLFRDHDHAANVLDGEIGQAMFADLAKTSNLQGLAFTYSGGYRMIAASRKITKLSDFQGLRIRVAHSDVAADTFRAVGAIPVPMDLEVVNEALASGQVDGGESTYPRFYSLKQNEVSSVINDTKHSLFLTSIVVSQSFWNSLTPDLQNIMIECAHHAAKLERNESVEDVQTIQGKCKTDGIAVVELPAAEQDKFRAATKSVYEKHQNLFSKGLVHKIQDA
jgi:tripartite ATP-independent transporter DctP family solute receptor